MFVEGKCKRSYGPSCPVVFVHLIYSFIQVTVCHTAGHYGEEYDD